MVDDDLELARQLFACATARLEEAHGVCVAGQGLRSGETATSLATEVRKALEATLSLVNAVNVLDRELAE